MDFSSNGFDEMRKKIAEQIQTPKYLRNSVSLARELSRVKWKRGYKIKYLTGLKLRNADIKKMKILTIWMVQNPFGKQ